MKISVNNLKSGQSFKTSTSDSVYVAKYVRTDGPRTSVTYECGGIVSEFITASLSDVEVI